MRKLFDKYDADSNGLLDESELGGLLREAAPSRAVDADHLLAEFSVADINSDGGVSFPEFVRYYAVMVQMAPGAGLSAAEIKWLRQIFDRFDGDKDGSLVFSELADLLRQCFPSRSADAKKLMAEIKSADLNKDKKVCLARGRMHGGCIVDEI